MEEELCEQERLILLLLGKKDENEIAAELEISKHTVRSHIWHLERLGYCNLVVKK